MYSMKLPYVESGSKQSLCRSLGTDATSGLAAADGTGVVVFILAMAFTVCWLDVTKDGLKARIEKKERLAAGRSPQIKNPQGCGPWSSLRFGPQCAPQGKVYCR